MSKTAWTLLLVMSMAGIAAIYPIVKVLDGTVDPFLLAFFRFLIAALALLPVVMLRHAFALPKGKEWYTFFFIAACAVAPTALIVVGVAKTNTIVSAILINSNPLIVAFLAPFLIAEHVSSKKILGLALGFLGVISIVLNGQAPGALFHSEYLLGSLVLLTGALLSALNKIYSLNLVKRYDGLFVTFFAVALGSAMLALIVMGQQGFGQVFQLAPRSVLMLLAMGIVSTAIPWTIWSSSLKHLDVHVAASFNLLVPVFATLYSFVFFDESFTIWALVGMILTSIGIYIVQKEGEARPIVPQQ